MSKKIIISIFFLIGLLLVPLASNAEELGKFGVGFRGGWYKSNDADEGKLYGGFQARWRIFPALAIEGSIDYRTEETYPYNRKITNYPVLVTALFYLIPGAQISPYLLGGVGWYFSELKDDYGTNNFNEFGAHAGGGVDIPITPNIVFNTDIRYYFLNFDNIRVKDLEADGYIITAGLTFYLW
jgi:opacity protein-like surface antigen